MFSSDGHNGAMLLPGSVVSGSRIGLSDVPLKLAATPGGMVCRTAVSWQNRTALMWMLTSKCCYDKTGPENCAHHFLHKDWDV